MWPVWFSLARRLRLVSFLWHRTNGRGSSPFALMLWARFMFCLWLKLGLSPWAWKGPGCVVLCTLIDQIYALESCFKGKNLISRMFPFFIKLIRHFLSFCSKKRWINLTKRGKDPSTKNIKKHWFLVVSWSPNYLLFEAFGCLKTLLFLGDYPELKC